MNEPSVHISYTRKRLNSFNVTNCPRAQKRPGKTPTCDTSVAKTACSNPAKLDRLSGDSSCTGQGVARGFELLEKFVWNQLLSASSIGRPRASIRP